MISSENGWRGSGKLLPGQADAAAPVPRTPCGRKRRPPACDACRLRGGLHHGVERIDGGHHQQFHALALLFRDGDYVREQLLLVVGEELVVAQIVFGGAGGELANGHHHDVVAAQVGFLERLVAGATCGGSRERPPGRSRGARAESRR